MIDGRRPLKTRQAAWARALAAALAARRITPNGISLAGMVLATVGAGALLAVPSGWLPPAPGLFLGALGIQLRLLCNMLDGMVALEGGLKGRAGDLFNEAPDRYEDIVLLVAAGYAAGQPTLGWCAATLAVLTAYTRALGASLGQGQDFCGPCAKPHRMFLLTVGCLGAIAWRPLLPAFLAIIALGTLATAARRIVRLYRRLP